MRLYRFLLRLLPLEFRDRFGRELERLFRAQQRDASRDGPGSRLRLWADTIGGLLLVAPREHLSILRQDASLAWRMLRRSPGLTLTAAGILAVSLGATTAVFSVVSAVLLRPLPFREPQAIVTIAERNRDGTPGGVAPPMLAAWETRATQLAHVTAVSASSLALTADGAETLIDGYAVASGFFDVFGVEPALGRRLAPAPLDGQAPQEVVLSHEFWASRFGGDARVLGRTLQLSNHPATIVGVMPKGFRPVHGFDVLVPLVFEPDKLQSSYLGARYLEVYGRLKDAVEPVAAEAELAAIARRTRAEGGWKDADEAGAQVLRLHDRLVSDYRQTLWLMFGTVALVLLVAAANVSSLLLARAVTRREELAVRAALGASSTRLFRQVLTESLVLAAVSGLAALAVAGLVLPPLVARLPPGLPRLNAIALDWRVFAFAGLAAIFIGTALGLAPAARVTARRLFHLLSTAGRQASSNDSTFVRQALLALEVAATFVLVVAGVLMAEHFSAVQRKDLGFSPANVVTASVSLPPTRYSTPERLRLFAARLVTEARTMHGTAAAGLDCNPPLGVMSMLFGYRLEDGPAPKGDRMAAQYHCVAGGSFAAYGTRILEGRAFDDRDQDGGPPVAIVNAWMARKYWPGRSPIGQRIKVGSKTGLVTREIVGVAASLHHKSLVEAEGAEIYVPFASDPWNNMVLAVRVDGARDTAPARVREIVARVDPALEVMRIGWLEDDVAYLLAPVQFQTLLLGSFAVTALVLSLVCIHGVTSYVVALRTREMGVRIALGASPGRVIRLVIMDALRPILTGTAVGLVIAIGLSRVLRLDLAGLNVAGIGTSDIWTLGAGVTILLVVALGATWLPARRATRVDPLIALRAS